MNRLKRPILVFICSLLVVAAVFVPLNLYISKPGSAYEVAPFIEVVDGDEEDKGSFNLMTISLAKATPLSWVYAMLSDKRKILPVTSVRRSGEGEEEYQIRQQKMMADSQYNAIHVAFDQVQLPYEVVFDGVFIMSVDRNGASANQLRAGDKIQSIEGEVLESATQLIEQLQRKQAGAVVDLMVERDKKLLHEKITVQPLPTDTTRIGLGIQFEEVNQIKTDPEVLIKASNIGGPSAGLMYTLEIMNQLLEEDLTKGYKVAGTGEITATGDVLRIGGVDFKVLAADAAQVDVFFAPADEVTEEMKRKNPTIQSNYEEAVQTAQKTGSSMKIVPVHTIEDALTYLENLSPKK